MSNTEKRIDALAIIDKYYADNAELRELLVMHSRQVAELADEIAAQHPELGADRAFMAEAAILHDIGICRTDAPGIHCHGTEPYICHGVLGAEMLRAEGLPRHARVCERHTGAGLTREDIISRNLPLPQRDFLPETIEEQIICFADKFFSKSRPTERKTLEQARRSVAKFSEEGGERFDKLAKSFL